MDAIADWESGERPEGPWALMFHHFHGGQHPGSPGSLDGDQFRKMLLKVQESHIVVGPTEFLDVASHGGMDSRYVLLTFDDALRSQFDIALPILDELSLDALFNVYSAVWSKEPPMLEVWAWFRSNAHDSFDVFYESFLLEINFSGHGPWEKMLRRYPSDYLSLFPFYSENERKFRFLRDMVLNFQEYSEVMNRMMARSGHEPATISQMLWMSKENVSSLKNQGSDVGLHSFSHPTQISSLSVSQQKREYDMNFSDIMEITGEAPQFVAHPCGDYSSETLAILSDLGIQVGFRSSPTGGGMTRLEIPREDHSVVAHRMGIR
jgi:peptidoglycan/xylan/chitin deacetylase (PgdA/CDA1 family)